MPFSRLRRLLARGWVVFADPGKEQEAPVEPDPDPDVSEDETRDSDEPVPMSAREGNTGWWVVTYSDGSEKNMRWAAVEELGLTPEQE